VGEYSVNPSSTSRRCCNSSSSVRGYPLGVAYHRRSSGSSSSSSSSSSSNSSSGLPE